MSQHHADARTELEARLLAYDLGSAFSDNDAHEFAADFIRWLDEHGWAPYVVTEPRQQHTKPADKARVHQIVEEFHQQRTEGA